MTPALQKLVIQDDEGKTTIVPLIKDEITVGRKEGNTIRLTERNVSRRHARIVRANGTVEIEDLDSYNGVKVNGTRIQGRVGLSPSDRIQIGDYLIELKTDGISHANGSPVEEQPTRPIERMNHGQAAGVAAVPQELPDEAPTRRVPQPVTFPVQSATVPPPAADPHANTDPGHTAVPVSPVPEPVVVPDSVYGRLVILSDNFAGREYELNRADMVIGRTDDNAIVVNHRSISRHHAKIVRENGRYAIIDLQSSNGVRVNGEEYGKVELRRGDVIDLGHVRLRFVEPGEDFVFGRDAHPVPIPTRGNRGLLYGVLVVVVVAVVGIFALTRGDDEDEPAPQTIVSPSDSPADSITEVESPDPGPFEQPTPPRKKATADEISPILKATQRAIEKEKWSTAVDKAEEVLELDPGNETAKQRLAKAARERKNQLQYGKFQSAAKSKDYATVARRFTEIDDDSVYKDRARDDYDRLYRLYTKEKKVEADRLVNQRKCAALATLRQKAEALWSKSAEQIRRLETRCKQQPAQTSQRKSTPRPTPRVERPVERPPAEKLRPSGKSYEELMEEVKESAGKGLYGAALKSCKPAYKKKPTQNMVAQCGLLACKARAVRDAKRFYERADATRKGVIKQTCFKAGIDPTR
ncbi:MAG: FHA domain-containing protein [Proteobacteria bacterium]|nr:FHA domain-containing protein [Pseudomonadota bacterium]